MGSNKHLKTISEGAAIVFIGMLASKVLAYFYRMIVARYLGSADYGLLSLGLAVVGIISIVSLLGFPPTLLRYISFYRGKRDFKSINAIIYFILKITTLLSIIIAILLFFFSDYLAINVFAKPQLGAVIKIFSFMLPLIVWISNIEKIIQAFKLIKYNIWARNIVENLAKVIFAALALLLGYKLLGVVAAYALGMLCSALLLSYLLHKKVYSLYGIWKDKVSVSRELFSFSLPLFFSQVLTNLLAWTDTLLLGYFVQSSLVGVYNAAMPTARLVHMIPVSIRTLFVPIIGERYGEQKSIEQIYKVITKWIFFVTLPITCVLVIFSKQALYILFGAEYTQGALALSLLSLALFIYALSFTSANVLLIMKKTNILFFNTTFVVLVNLVLNLILIPQYGILGAAIATSVAFLLEVFLVQIQAYYYTKIIPFNLNYLKSIFSAIIACTLLFLIKEFYNIGTNIPLLVFLSLFFCIVYIALLIFTNSFEKEDMDILKMLEKRTGIGFIRVGRLFVRK